MNRYVALLILMSLGLIGCGPSVPVAPVSGKVRCRGELIKNAAIQFSPVVEGDGKAQGRAAGGEINDQGEYHLSTYGNKDGAILGKHRVAISYNDPYKEHPCTPPTDLVLEVKAGTNVLDIELDKTFKK